GSPRAFVEAPVGHQASGSGGELGPVVALDLGRSADKVPDADIVELAPPEVTVGGAAADIDRRGIADGAEGREHGGADLDAVEVEGEDTRRSAQGGGHVVPDVGARCGEVKAEDATDPTGADAGKEAARVD